MRFFAHFFWMVLLGSLLNGVACYGETTTTREREKSDAFYSPFGKRDPFRVPSVGGLGDDRKVGPLQRYPVDQYLLKGIIRGLGKAKAMFQDPRGVSHIVGEGDLIGLEKATVSRIVKSEVIITERTFNYLGKESLLEKVIALPKEDRLDPIELTPGSAKSLASKKTPGGSQKPGAQPGAEPGVGQESESGVEREPTKWVEGENVGFVDQTMKEMKPGTFNTDIPEPEIVGGDEAEAEEFSTDLLPEE